MFHSISRRHQIFYSLLVLLAFIILGFAAAWQFERNRILSPIDAELQSRITRTTGLMVRMSRDRAETAEDATPKPLYQPQNENNFEADGKSAPYYYKIWTTQTEKPVLKFQSASAPEDIAPPVDTPVSSTYRTTRMRGNYRELIHNGRHGFLVVVGRDISAELSIIKRKSARFAIIGGLLLAGVLLHSFRVATQALKPVVAINKAATRIADGALDERVEITSNRSELGQLGDVLNHTFDKLESAYLRQARFTADASHELRTPVAVILTEIQSAPKNSRTQEEYEECLSVCEEAATSMQNLLQQLMVLVQFDAGKVEKSDQSVDFSELAERCVERIKPLAELQEVNVTSDIRDNVTCHGDSDRIVQIVNNLLNNAVSYNRKGGEVSVILEQTDENAVLKVSDTGQGISEEDLPHLFERFYRADKSRFGEGEHSGLGLAICKEIVDIYGGTIEVESKLGEGSVFALRLPV